METSALKQINLDGFQLVNSSLFSSLNAPSMTIWPDSVSFSQAAYAALNNCEAISIMINNVAKSILISTVPSNSANAVLWRKSKSVAKYCKLSCATFARQLFEDWKLDEKARYRTIGRMVQVDKKVMVLFEFENAEKWLGDKAVK